MKKFVGLILTVSAVIVLLCVGVSAARVAGVTADGLKYAIVDNSYVAITGYTDEFSGVFSLPSVIEGYNVTKIEGSAFSKCKSLTTAVIPANITEIGGYAFSDCENLEKVTISGSSVKVGSYNFENCGKLKTAGPVGSGCDLEFAWNDKIPKYAFNGCTGLTSVIVPDGITEICDYAFETCVNLVSVSIPDSVKTIGNYAFYRCNSLDNLTLPKNLLTIGKYAFCYCITLTTVTIPDGVTSLGAGVFSNDINLSKVTIPASVANIGQDVFAANKKLTTAGAIGSGCDIEFGWTSRIPKNALYGSAVTTVTVPDGVTAIGDSAFYGCRKLTKVTIPKSVTTLGNNVFSVTGNLYTAGSFGSGCNIEFGWSDEIPAYAFYSCSDLMSITIPDGVTSIGPWAFYKCISLTGVTMPDSVTSIGDYAFIECRELTEVTIPKSVTKIGLRAFRDCSKLTSIMFRGNAPVTIWVSEEYYRSLPMSATLYYLTNKSGWTDSDAYDAVNGTWNGYKLEKWNGVVPVRPIEVKKGKFTVYVIDENGNALEDASVKYASQSGKTDDKGYVYFDKTTWGEPEIEASLDGYMTWSNVNTNWRKSSDMYEIVVLYKDDAETAKLRLSHALYSNNKNMNAPVNILVYTKKISLGNDILLCGDLDFGNFYLQCSAMDVGEVEKYQLWQSNDFISESDDGYFALSTDSFADGEKCYVRVIGKNGRTRDTHINLSFSTAKKSNDAKFSLDGTSTSFSVPDWVPFLGGSKCSFKLPVDLPISFFVTDNIIHVGVNLDIYSSDDSAYKGKTEDEITHLKNREYSDNLRKTKKSQELINKMLGGKKLSASDLKAYDSLIKNKNMKASFIKSVDVKFLGYLEGDIAGKKATGQLMLQLSSDLFGFEYNTIVPVIMVPITIQIDCSGEVAAVGNVTYEWENAKWYGYVGINGSITLKAFGGVGVSKLAGAGAYGSAKLAVGWNIIGTPKGVQYVDLTGELGAKVYAGPFVYEKAFAYNTWHLYTANSVKSAAPRLYAASSWNGGVYDTSQYKAADLTYLENESEWLGETEDSEITLFAASGSGNTADEKTEFRSLIEETYRNAQPVMISADEGIFTAFIRADASDNDVYCVLSKYDGTSWCSPVTVDENAVFDGNPQLAVDGDGTVWLAYTATKADFDRTSLLSYALAQQLVIGTVDADTLEFTEKYRCDADGYINMISLTVVGGSPAVVYNEAAVTDENSVLWCTVNTIHSVMPNGNEWAENTLYSVDSSVIDIAAGDRSGNLTVAYTLDTDGDGSTTDDVSLYSDGVFAADNVNGAVKYALLPGEDEYGFVVNGEGTLISADTRIDIPGITQEYAVVGDRIYYSGAVEDSAELFVITYDAESGTFGNPIQLTEGGRYFENIGVVSYDGNDYALGMYTETEIGEDFVTDSKNLVWTRICAVSDIVLDSFDYESEGITEGCTVPVTVYVVNSGDHTVESIDISVNGEYLRTESVSIASGETAEIALELVCPSALTQYTVTVTETGRDDYNPADNSTEVGLGYADVGVSVDFRQIGTGHTLVAEITNVGVEAASGSAIFYNGSNEAVAEYKFDGLAAGDCAFAEYSFTEGTVYGEDYTVVLAYDHAEINTFNDTDIYYVSYESEIIGDIDGNGVPATPADAQTLARYIAGWKVDIVPENADLDADGKITPRDSMILTRHIAGWEGYESLPYTK